MHTNFILDINRSPKPAQHLLMSLIAMLVLSLAQPAPAQTQQKTFASPEQAAQTLYDAVQNKDNQAVESILGAAELTSSGNDDEDKLERERFTQKYQEMHRLVREADGTTMLYIGAENWPFPLPLIATNGQWHFDSDSGLQEIQARQVGENESLAIEVCEAMTKASAPGVEKTSDVTPVLEFAQNLAKSQSAKPGASEAFHGYYFRISERKRGNTLVVAYPIDYGVSGVMTFVVVNGSVVYERDLGPQTVTIAQTIQKKPSRKWSRVQ